MSDYYSIGPSGQSADQKWLVAEGSKVQKRYDARPGYVGKKVEGHYTWSQTQVLKVGKAVMKGKGAEDQDYKGTTLTAKEAFSEYAVDQLHLVSANYSELSKAVTKMPDGAFTHMDENLYRALRHDVAMGYLATTNHVREMIIIFNLDGSGELSARAKEGAGEVLTNLQHTIAGDKEASAVMEKLALKQDIVEYAFEIADSRAKSAPAAAPAAAPTASGTVRGKVKAPVRGELQSAAKYNRALAEAGFKRGKAVLAEDGVLYLDINNGAPVNDNVIEELFGLEKTGTKGRYKITKRLEMEEIKSTATRTFDTGMNGTIADRKKNLARGGLAGLFDEVK